MFGRGRPEPRLDPVRWRRPGRTTLLRLAATAALLGTAAAVAWSDPPGCTPSGRSPAAGASAPGAPASGSTGRSGARADPGPRADPGLPDARGNASGPDGTGSAGAPDSGGPSTGGTSTGGVAGRDGGAISGVPGPAELAGVPGGTRPAVPAGTAGVPVRLAEPAALRLVRPGDHVDLLTVDDASARAVRVADAALVLAVSGVDDPTAGGLLLALRPAEARRVIGTRESTRFAVLIRPQR